MQCVDERVLELAHTGGIAFGAQVVDEVEMFPVVGCVVSVEESSAEEGKLGHLGAGLKLQCVCAGQATRECLVLRRAGDRP